MTLEGDDVTDDLDKVSDNDGSLTLGFGGSHSLDAGDRLCVIIECVRNPEAGEYDATITLNSQSDTQGHTVEFIICVDDDEQADGGEEDHAEDDDDDHGDQEDYDEDGETMEDGEEVDADNDDDN